MRRPVKLYFQTCVFTIAKIECLNDTSAATLMKMSYSGIEGLLIMEFRALTFAG